MKSDLTRLGSCCPGCGGAAAAEHPELHGGGGLVAEPGGARRPPRPAVHAGQGARGGRHLLHAAPRQAAGARR